MATTIVTKNGSGVPLDTDLLQGELAVDLEGQKLYSKNASGTVVEIAPASEASSLSWDDVENKPTEFPPSPHAHPWGEITDKPDLVEEAPDDGKQYVRESEAWAEIVVPEGGTGSSVHIGENPPADPQEGQQWMEVPATGDATMWIYDGGKWLQQPGGKDGQDGQDGQDGADGQGGGESLWTDEGSNTISYSGTVLMSQPDAGANALSLGPNAGKTTQGVSAVALGHNAGQINQGEYTVAVGMEAGKTNQENLSTAVGCAAGYTDQGAHAVAVGYNSGVTAQGTEAVSVGYLAGYNTQGQYGVGIGYNAGYENQGTGAVAIGGAAGNVTQGDSAVSIGASAGELNQGAESIAIGKAAGQSNQAANSIIISSAGSSENSGNPNHIYITSGENKYLLYDGSSNWYFAGGPVNGLNGFRQNGSPVIDAKGLINTLSTLRQATMDETQDIRESLRSAIDELVDGFEQEIAAMPAGDES